MSRSPFTQHMARCLIVMTLLAISLGACAPSQAMIATLTQLPITVTPTLPPPPPTYTKDPNATPTVTLTPAYSYPTETETPDASVTQTPDLELTLTAAAPALPSMTPAQDTPAPQDSPTPNLTAAACPPFNYDTSIPAPDTPSNYIGKHFDDRSLPSSLKWLGSGMLSNSSYSYTHIEWQGREMYWIQKLVCQNTSGMPYWEISDVLALPKMDSAAHETTTDLCFQGEAAVPFVIAYGTYQPSDPAAQVVSNFTGWKMQVKSAWQMKERFVPLSTQELTCMVQK